MSYVSQAQLVDAFGEAELVALTDRLNSPPQYVEASVLQQAISDVDRLIDSYVAAVETLPLPQATIDASPLSGLAADLVRYQLYGQQPTDLVQTRRDQAIGWLRDLAAGRVTLVTGQAVAPAPGASRVTHGVSGIDWSSYP